MNMPRSAIPRLTESSRNQTGNLFRSAHLKTDVRLPYCSASIQ